MMTLRSMTFCSSRMLPGQSYCKSAAHQIVGDRVDYLALLSSELFDEVFGQQGDVASPFP